MAGYLPDLHSISTLTISWGNGLSIDISMFGWTTNQLDALLAKWKRFTDPNSPSTLCWYSPSKQICTHIISPAITTFSLCWCYPSRGWRGEKQREGNALWPKDILAKMQDILGRSWARQKILQECSWFPFFLCMIWFLHSLIFPKPLSCDYKPLGKGSHWPF